MHPDNVLEGRNLRQTVNRSGGGFAFRYLAAKKGVDDRALNRHVWETLRSTLPQTAAGEPAVILEIGAGIGTMLERIIDRGLLTGPAIYHVTDCDEDNLAFGRRYLAQWAERCGHVLSWSGEHHCRLLTANFEVSIFFKPARAEELALRFDIPGPCHLLIAHAVLDLIDFPVVMPHLFQRLAENGLAYLTCNFDGDTVFFPEYHGELDITRLYHASMEKRLAGASRTGRRLLGFLQRPGLELLAAGSSDWLILPGKGGYPDDEAFFLHAIIATVEQELANLDDSPPGLGAWSRLRHRQVETGELSFFARHLDFLVRRLSLRP
jgi:SAM-dependent methyltransferase